MFLSIFFLQFAFSASIPRRNILTTALNNQISCKICEHAIATIKQFYQPPISEDEITEKINKLCSQYPEPYRNLCYSTLADYASFILIWLDQDLTPTEICAKFNLCKSSNKNIKPLKPFKSLQNSFGCDMCTTTVEYIAKLLESQVVESEIIVLVDKYCETFESPYSTLCASIFEKAVPIVISYIEEGLVAFDICTKIGLCANETSSSVVMLSNKEFKSRLAQSSHYKSLKVKNAFPKNVGGFGCAICEKLLNDLEVYMTEPIFLSSLDYLLDSVCTLLPNQYTELCTSIVDDLIQWIVEDLDSELDRLQICTRVGLCPNKTTVANVQRRPSLVRHHKRVNDQASCTICTITVNYIDGKMKDAAVREEILEALSSFCAIFEGLYTQICRSIAYNYVPLIMDLISEGTEALDICNQLGFCPGVSNHNKFARTAIAQVKRPIKTIVPRTPKNGLCETCQQAIELVVSLLEDKKVEEEIIDALDDFCATLPSDISPTCMRIAETYVPLVITLIESGIETLDICVKIGFCQ